MLVDIVPIVLSQPVAPATAQESYFEIALNTGDIIAPYSTGIGPNLDYNERKHISVILLNVGDRKYYNQKVAYHVAVHFVEDGTPNAHASAVGSSCNTTGHPHVYERPKSCDSKASYVNATGDDGPTTIINDGIILYGVDISQYHLRILTTGGYIPN